MSQVMKNIVASRTMGTYGTNAIGDLVRTLDDHFKTRDFQLIDVDQFAAENEGKVSLRGYLVVCAIRGHYIRLNGNLVFIWVNKAVFDLAQELDV